MNQPIRTGRYPQYLRKSRSDLDKEAQGGFETLASQKEALDEFMTREGYPIEEVFTELVSGESVIERIEFQKLMEGVSARRYAGVVVHAVDRLGRGDMMEFGWILSTLFWSSDKLTCSQPFSSDSARPNGFGAVAN